MNIEPHTYKPVSNIAHKQQGAAIIGVTLLMVSVLTVVGISTSKSSTIEAKIATNFVERQKAIIAADSAIYYAWNQSNSDFDIDSFVENCNIAGSYDLRTSGTITDCTTANEQTDTPAAAKTLTDWQGITSTADWDWTANMELPNALSMESSVLGSSEQTNPMKLATAPQYAVGIHDPVLRKGTENYHCIPISVIGAGKGALNNAQALIEVKAIPKSGCFRNMIH